MARVEVAKVQNNDMFGNLAKGVLPMVGQAVGTAYGGPAGGAAGGMIGGAISGGISTDAPNPVSSPVSRQMEKMQQDPTNVLKQGRAALAGMDDQTKAALSPVLDEAIKKASMQTQAPKQGGF